MEKIKVFLVDDSPLFREGLAQALEKTVEVVAESGIDEEAVLLIASFSPDIVLLDIGLPMLTGLPLARQITQRSPATLVVILTPYDDDEQLFQAIKSGAVGYINKETTADELGPLLIRIQEGERPINDMVLSRPKVAEKVLKQFQDLSLLGVAMETLATPLTPRELEIIGYVARGYVNKQVADKLGLSEQTIKNHMSSILRKLDANDRTQAVVLALHYGWITPPFIKEEKPAAKGKA